MSRIPFKIVFGVTQTRAVVVTTGLRTSLVHQKISRVSSTRTTGEVDHHRSIG